MGGLLSYIWGPSWAAAADDDDPNLDIPDEGTGLTTREKNAVRDTWALVKADYKASGIALFLKFFKTFPEYQKHFKGFATVPLDELPNNPKLHAHAAGVLYALTSFVDNLDDVACLKEMLLKSAKAHYGRGIVEQQFKNLATVILEFLPERFGSKITPVAVEGWTKVLNAIVSIIGEGLEMAKKGQLE